MGRLSKANCARRIIIKTQEELDEVEVGSLIEMQSQANVFTHWGVYAGHGHIIHFNPDGQTRKISTVLEGVKGIVQINFLRELQPYYSYIFLNNRDGADMK
ncbi:hypothetical protein ElyMa_004854100 [Elysia marginata]|uniref:LRAT domain-containing protein n=1 Tax=Elysia marginata TaxID=1093978 RepID=A0AAV4INV6_9GAST|nr:hypothetical protein ElyMa_004854100 [Elysia marginata]